MNTVGDLGRRLAERRRELGLSSEEVATRAGMDPGYLRLLEKRPSPQPSRAALWRLAAALETSVDAIMGSGMDTPPGRAHPQDQPMIEPLSVGECKALIAPGGVGRVVFSDHRGPSALPVNFRIWDDDIVFSTQSESTILKGLAKGDISFEVDHLDEALTEGWSVLISGVGQALVDPTEREQARSLDIVPWAGGQRDTYVRLIPRQVTGRRIRQRSDR